MKGKFIHYCVLLLVAFQLSSCAFFEDDSKNTGVTEGGNAAGIACTESGDAVEGADVIIRQRDFLAEYTDTNNINLAKSVVAFEILDTLSTDQDGYFEFPDSLPPGKYNIEINDGESMGVFQEYEHLALDEDDTTHFVLGAYATLTGAIPNVVFDSADVFIKVYGMERGIKIDYNLGRFTIENLPPGEYDIRLEYETSVIYFTELAEDLILLAGESSVLPTDLPYYMYADEHPENVVHFFGDDGVDLFRLGNPNSQVGDTTVGDTLTGDTLQEYQYGLGAIGIWPNKDTEMKRTLKVPNSDSVVVDSVWIYPPVVTEDTSEVDLDRSIRIDFTPHSSVFMYFPSARGTLDRDEDAMRKDLRPWLAHNLVFDIKTEQEVYFKISSIEEDIIDFNEDKFVDGLVEITAYGSTLSGQWEEVSIPLAEFEKLDVDFKQLKHPFYIGSKDSATVYIDNIRYEPAE